ncbi:hypothetical protein SOVF_134310 [Spinacia oleracea]|nr:hypothetical protein SOVF_134310 [Spinacia oleracea]
MVLVLAAEAAIVFATPSLVAAAIPSTLLLLQSPVRCCCYRSFSS